MLLQKLLSVDQTLPWDYRDELREAIERAIERKHTSAFRICKEVGIANTGVLTNILKKHRHISIAKMLPLLEYLDCRIAIVPKRKRSRLRDIPKGTNA